MKLRLERFSSGPDSTLGLLFVDGSFVCFTCEDEHRDVKVAAETRIPAGTYEIKLRTEGGFHDKYSKRFAFHRGMLHLQDVPGFTWIYIHIGNTEKDTAGCILVGLGARVDDRGGGRVMTSALAYETFYPRVIDAAEAGDLSIEIVDKDLVNFSALD